MTIWKGVLDAEVVKPGVVDAEVNKWGVIDAELVAVASSLFNPALMAAMHRPWRDIVFDAPAVVASGVTPPDRPMP